MKNKKKVIYKKIKRLKSARKKHNTFSTTKSHNKTLTLSPVQDKRTKKEQATQSSIHKPVMENLNTIDKYISDLNSSNNEINKEIVFAISLKSKRASRNWQRVQNNLAKTLRTIFNNTDQHYRIIIAGHKKPTIPELKHSRVTWLKVKFPPPLNSKGYSRDKLLKRNVIGSHLRRIGYTGYFMPVDADDWIHHRFVEYIRKCPKTDAFVFNSGFMVNVSNQEVWQRNRFYIGCGTSQLFYFTNREFPISSKRKDVLKTNFKIVGRRHGSVKTHLSKINKKYTMVNTPLLTWVLAHGDNNTMIKKKKDNTVSAKDYNAQGEELSSDFYKYFKITKK
ncbi:hypothetical protein FS935_00920 [Metabacillus litoralis]|uniref:Uncharacterized protein n=1 Tax=Metabacillus litoralis TaxID=152268 RepID=A0A5C6W5V9_9BACI|nr:hypothetical protein [Metabacillus litoralis]TXC92794.1 hypothetical protein FS935_00920 [Metabacillus litoralis]